MILLKSPRSPGKQSFSEREKNPAVISANCIPQGIHTQSTFHSDYIYEAIVELSSAATDIEQLFYPQKITISSLELGL